MSVPIQVSLILPTRNESANIAEAIERAKAALSDYAHEIIVVDDNSPDGTADIARDIASKDRTVRCLKRVGRRGLASACIEGALTAAGDVVVVMDADLQHDETILPKLVTPVLENQSDLSVGTRYTDGGGTSDWSEEREAQSAFATRLAKIVLKKTPLSDPMSGFFAIRANLFRELVPQLSGRGFKILLDLVFASDKPLRVHEEPFVFRSRDAGESKLDAPTALQFLMMIYERMFGHIVPVRFALFAAVGGLGIFVHMAVLFGLFRGLELGFVWAQTGAVVVAMTYNFLLNNILTFSDVRLKGWGLLKGWAVFCAVCGLGAIANVGVATYLFNESHVMWTVSALAGIIVGAVWNYAMSSRFTWGQL